MALPAKRRRADRAPLLLLAFYGAVIFFQAVGEGAARGFFNVYLDAGLGVPPAQIGAVMGAAQLLPIAVALTLPLILKKLGTGYTLVTAILGVSLCLLPLAGGAALWFAAASYMGIIAMTTLTGASRDLLGQELVTPRWRTTIQSVVIIGLALGWAAIGFVGGWLIEAVGFGAMWLTGVVCALIAAGMLVTFLRAVLRARSASLRCSTAPGRLSTSRLGQTTSPALCSSRRYDQNTRAQCRGRTAHSHGELHPDAGSAFQFK